MTAAEDAASGPCAMSCWTRGLSARRIVQAPADRCREHLLLSLAERFQRGACRIGGDVAPRQGNCCDGSQRRSEHVTPLPRELWQVSPVPVLRGEDLLGDMI